MKTRKFRFLSALSLGLVVTGSFLGGCSREAQETSSPVVAGTDHMPPEAAAAKERAEAANKARAEAQGRAMRQNQPSAPR